MKTEVFICIFSIFLFANGQICPSGWVDGPKGRKCYLFAKNHLRNWHEALYECQSMRAELLTIEDSTKMAWIKQELKYIKKPFPGKELEWWTSLNNQANLSNWVWTGDVPLDESVMQWASGEPNNHLNNERCGEICCPYYFNDKSCMTKLNYICELDKQTSPITCDSDNGWEYHSGMCYKFNKKYRTWNDSVSDCKDLDSDLASITDTYAKSSITVMANFQQSDSWVGLYKKDEAYYYTNATMATGIEQYLTTNQPTINKPRICMSINGTTEDHIKNLYGDDCTTTKPYICQKPEGVCKSGMLQHQSSCYYVSAAKMNRGNAEMLCSGLWKMSLVDITSASKSAYILSIVKRRGEIDEVWVGLKKQGNDWYWPSTGESPSLDYWANDPSEKNDSVNDCVYMNTGDGGKWHNNFGCDTKLRYVCESPARPLSLTTTVAPSTTQTTVTEPVTSTMKTELTSIVPTTENTTVSARPCNLEYCEDIFDHAKELEKHSSVMIQEAAKYSEYVHCISLRSRVQCVKRQEKSCFQHFQYHVQAVGIQEIMNHLGCSNETSAPVFNPSTMVKECRKEQMGLDYRGTISVTNHGRTCQAWTSQTPHKHNFDQDLMIDKNYCRNPDNTPGGPWCYTTDENQRWEFCDIPYCENAVTPSTTTLASTTTTAVATSPTRLVWSLKCGLFWETMGNSDICHHFGERLVSWTEARKKCRDIGGDLVSITSLHEQYYLTGRMSGNDLMNAVWIGANSRGAEEGWRWSDESPFSLVHWGIDQPDGIDEDENCVAMNNFNSGTWEDRQCDDQLGYVCRKTVSEPTAPTLPPKSPVVNKDQMFACEEGWVAYRSNCYFVNRTKTTWQGALSLCHLNGAELASIAEEGEHDFLISQLPDKFCYNIHSNDTECTKWAAEGECQKNPVWMAKHCHLGCNLCIRDCKNLHYSVECDHWAKMGECYNNHQWMLVNCPLSCGVCDGAIYGGFWIGMTDRKHQMSFEWSDDSPVTYTKWAHGEPNNIINNQISEDCIIMLLKNGYWNDVTCNDLYPGFICKKRKQVLDKVTESPFSAGCVNDTIGYDASCYGIVDTTADWDTAESICSQAPYGHLAMINDRYVQAFLSSQLVGKTGSYWIGLTQDRSSGVVESWANGLPVLFTHWAKSHTGSFDEDSMCVTMTASHPVGLWETKNCTLEMSYICEYPRTGFTTSTTTTTTTLPPTCPDNWREYENYCYKRMSSKMTWMKSRDFCRQRGADIVSIHGEREESFVRTLLPYQGAIWIGLNDRDSENGFTWSDGTPFDFSNWSPNEPNDKYDMEDCVEKNVWNGWNDDNCYKSKYTVCKIMKGMPLLEPNDTFTEEYCDSDKSWYYFNDYCYYFGKYQSLSYKDARQKCLDEQSDLISIHSQHEINWLLERLSGMSNMWVGLNKLSRHFENYRWSDNTPVDFIYWEENKPSDPLSNKCAKILYGSGRWDDTDCFRKESGYICKKTNTTEPPTLPPPPSIKGGCMKGFTRSPFNDKCYQLFKEEKTWSEADKSCQAYKGVKGSLVTIQSEIEQLFVASLLSGVSGDDRVWIGMTDIHSYRKYYWIDGSDVTYTNWNEKEPNGYDERCVDIFTEDKKFGQWNDERCSRSMYYMCQTFQDPIIPIDLPGEDGCPKDYTVHGSKCYKYIETANDWNKSMAICQEDSAMLATVINNQEKLFISYLTNNKTKPFWIGLHKADPEDVTYQWISEWPHVYSVWNPDSESPTKPCVASGNDFWEDKSCDEKLPALCQIINESPPATPKPLICGEGGYVFQEKCYYPSLHDRLNWVQAEDRCQMKGLHLASIHNLDHIEFMLNLVLKLTGYRQDLWIGLNKEDRYGSEYWAWSDGTPFQFSNWRSGEPSSKPWAYIDEKCVEMKATGKWNDVPCKSGVERSYFCQGDTVDEQTTLTPKEPETTVGTTVVIETTELTTKPSDGPSTKTTTLTIDTNQDSKKYISKKKIGSDESTTLTTGQIMGIIIGLLGCVIIVLSILFIVRFNRQKGSYNANSHSFSNALYLKTTENINEEDHADMGSTVKICKNDTL